jgi:hypothetical protein
MARVNLRETATYIARQEGLGKKVPIAQIAEILGILGDRWRNMSSVDVLREVACIVERAGMRSEHRKQEEQMDAAEATSEE